MRISTLLGIFALVATAAACQPATTYNRGMDLSFHPSARADGQSRLVDSAIELKQDVDQEAIKEAGGIYLGELDVTAEKTASPLASGPTAGGSTMSGRVSLDVASHGGTHFYLSTFDTQNGFGPPATPFGRHTEATQRSIARYSIYRVEPDAWARLDKQYRPEHQSGQPAVAMSAP